MLIQALESICLEAIVKLLVKVGSHIVSVLHLVGSLLIQLSIDNR